MLKSPLTGGVGESADAASALLDTPRQFSQMDVLFAIITANTKKNLNHLSLYIRVESGATVIYKK
jgi:hypothetical protein